MRVGQKVTLPGNRKGEVVKLSKQESLVWVETEGKRVLITVSALS